ncbi:MAG TPA: M1 family metallopeptidase, partial [Flavobacterium sp.]
MRFVISIILFSFVICNGQQTASVDFTTLNASISVDPQERKVYGSASYEFDVKTAIDTIRIDAVNMAFTNVKINNKKVMFNSSTKALNVFEGYKNGRNKLTFDYTAVPKQTMYFTGQSDKFQIWTQGQGKGTSHWLPSFDDMNEKVVFGLTVTFDKSFRVISNGTLKSHSQKGQNSIWKYQMKKPMSSYLVMLAIGKFYKKDDKSSSGIPLEMYYMPEDEGKHPFTYKNSAEIFNFLEREIGVPYPWEIYRQIPVQDFLYAGMENTSATIFSQDFVVDETGLNDRSYVNVNAHELAHQWFGDMVTAKSGKHHWLQEGFATYYALLAERALYGDDHFYN